MKIIPAIDLKDGKCVRLFKGDFGRQTEYSDDPLGMALRFAALAVETLHIVDLDGARSGRQRNRRIVEAILKTKARRAPIRIQLGGGLRHRDALSRWFEAGVSRCVIGSLAVSRPDEVADWLAAFGSERLVLALDVRIDEHGTPRLATHGWTRSSDTCLWDCIASFLEQGLTHVLCTDVSRDGAMAGPNMALYRETLRRFPALELQASGGIRHADDLRRLAAAGLPAAITGRALLDGAITAGEVASFPQGA